MATPVELRIARIRRAPGSARRHALGSVRPTCWSWRLLLVVAFWPILVGMYGSWFDENAYMEHGILVIPAAAYMAWAKRDKLEAIPRQPSGWGVVLLFWGALQALLGLAAQWVWVSRTAFLVSLVGCIAVVFGLRMIRELAYPLVHADSDDRSAHFYF